MGRAIEFTTLGKASTSITSGSRGWARYYAEDGALFLRMTNLPREGVRMRMGDLAFVRLPSGLAEAERTRVQRGDVLISITAELGKIGLVDDGPGDAFVNQHVACVRPNPHIVDSRYLAYYLASPDPRKRFQRLNDSGAKAGLNLKTLGNFRIALPFLDEQRRIAHILATWDTAIDKAERLLEKKARLFSGVQSRLMVAPAESKGWGREHLGDLAVITKGQQLNVSDMMDAGSNYVLNGGTGPSGRTNQWNTSANTITISEGGNSCGHVTFNVEPFWCGGHCYALKNLSERIEVRYLYHALKSRQDRLMSLRVGSGLPNIQIKDVRSFLVAVPSLPEQRRITQCLDTAEREMDVLGKLGQALVKQKVALGASLIPPHDGRVEP